MDKKWILAILLIILVFMAGGIYIFSNQEEEKNEVNNRVNNEQVLANNESEKQEGTNHSVSNPILNEEKTNSSENTNINKEDKNEITEKKVVSQVSPSGFMGSSLYRVVLYSNGEVYVKKFDGNGYEESNLLSNDLIAKDVSSIEAAKDDEHYGEVMIEGGEILNNNFGWISSK